jgi:hypothetical protein
MIRVRRLLPPPAARRGRPGPEAPQASLARFRRTAKSDGLLGYGSIMRTRNASVTRVGHSMSSYPALRNGRLGYRHTGPPGHGRSWAGPLLVWAFRLTGRKPSLSRLWPGPRGPGPAGRYHRLRTGDDYRNVSNRILRGRIKAHHKGQDSERRERRL